MQTTSFQSSATAAKNQASYDPQTKNQIYKIFYNKDAPQIKPPQSHSLQFNNQRPPQQQHTSSFTHKAPPLNNETEFTQKPQPFQFAQKQLQMHNTQNQNNRQYQNTNMNFPQPQNTSWTPEVQISKQTENRMNITNLNKNKSEELFTLAAKGKESWRQSTQPQPNTEDKPIEQWKQHSQTKEQTSLFTKPSSQPIQNYPQNLPKSIKFSSQINYPQFSYFATSQTQPNPVHAQELRNSPHFKIQNPIPASAASASASGFAFKQNVVKNLIHKQKVNRVVGECVQMCAIQECKERENTNDLNLFEIHTQMYYQKRKQLQLEYGNMSESDFMKVLGSNPCNPSWCVKKYVRAAADRKMDNPHILRPPRVIFKLNLFSNYDF